MGGLERPRTWRPETVSCQGREKAVRADPSHLRAPQCVGEAKGGGAGASSAKTPTPSPSQCLHQNHPRHTASLSPLVYSCPLPGIAQGSQRRALHGKGSWGGETVPTARAAPALSSLPPSSKGKMAVECRGTCAPLKGPRRKDRSKIPSLLPPACLTPLWPPRGTAEPGPGGNGAEERETKGTGVQRGRESAGNDSAGNGSDQISPGFRVSRLLTVRDTVRARAAVTNNPWPSLSLAQKPSALSLASSLDARCAASNQSETTAQTPEMAEARR